jgi:hypothetical protein
MGVGANPAVLLIAGLTILVLIHFWFLTRTEMPMKNKKNGRKANLKTKSTMSQLLSYLYKTTRELAINIMAGFVTLSIHQKGAQPLR